MMEKGHPSATHTASSSDSRLSLSREKTLKLHDYNPRKFFHETMALRRIKHRSRRWLQAPESCNTVRQRARLKILVCWGGIQSVDSFWNLRTPARSFPRWTTVFNFREEGCLDEGNWKLDRSWSSREEEIRGGEKNRGTRREDEEHLRPRARTQCYDDSNGLTTMIPITMVPITQPILVHIITQPYDEDMYDPETYTILIILRPRHNDAGTNEILRWLF